MNDYKMILADDEQIVIDSFTLPLHVVVNCESEASALAIWQKLIPENLETIVFFEGSEKTAEFANVELKSVQFVPNEGCIITAHFYFLGENRSASAENSYVSAAKILLGEEE